MDDRRFFEMLLADAKHIVDAIEERLKKPFVGEIEPKFNRVQMSDINLDEEASPSSERVTGTEPAQPFGEMGKLTAR